MIRIRFFWAQGIKSEGFFGRTVVIFLVLCFLSFLCACSSRLLDPARVNEDTIQVLCAACRNGGEKGIAGPKHDQSCGVGRRTKRLLFFND